MCIHKIKQRKITMQLQELGLKISDCRLDFHLFFSVEYYDHTFGTRLQSHSCSNSKGGTNQC